MNLKQLLQESFDILPSMVKVLLDKKAYLYLDLEVLEDVRGVLRQVHCNEKVFDIRGSTVYARRSYGIERRLYLAPGEYDIEKRGKVFYIINAKKIVPTKE